MKFTVDVITEKCVVVSFENGAKVQCQSRKAAALLVSNTIMTVQPEPLPEPAPQLGPVFANTLANMYAPVKALPAPKVPAKTLAGTVRDIIDSNETWSTSKSFEVSGFFADGYRAWVSLNSSAQIVLTVMRAKNAKRQSTWVVGSLQVDGWAPVAMISDNIRLAQQWVEKDSK